jgi:hypothetical protein
MIITATILERERKEQTAAKLSFQIQFPDKEINETHFIKGHHFRLKMRNHA